MTNFRAVPAALASPIFLILAVTFGLLLVAGVGPVQYPNFPAAGTLIIVIPGLLTFVVGCTLGIKLAAKIRNGNSGGAQRTRILNIAVLISAILGLTGIACIAFDRAYLSGIDPSIYSQILRCAPDLIELVSIHRSVFLYIGYVTFSFGFAALTLFLLRAEEIRTVPALLAQANVLVPTGYALLYSGRMPILLCIVLLAAAGVVRLYQGRRLIPSGHHLILKSVVCTIAFLIYSNVMWQTRSAFCEAVVPATQEFQQGHYVDGPQAGQRQPDVLRTDNLNAGGQRQERTAQQKITASDLVEIIRLSEKYTAIAKHDSGAGIDSFFKETMVKSWGVMPSAYINWLRQRKLLNDHAAQIVIANTFYLTHGVMTLDRIWAARADFHPRWGIYQIGILSPLLRVLRPDGTFLLDMNKDLKDARIYGFFPSAWGAAMLDFGAVGGLIYVFFWGLMGGWAYGACRKTFAVTPPLVLSFTLMTVMLSSIQGPLGISNSALVFGSILALGLVADIASKWKKLAS